MTSSENLYKYDQVHTIKQLQVLTSESACPYIPNQMSKNEFLLMGYVSGADYEKLMNQGFRRSGYAVYRPQCNGCNACQSLRVLVDDFVVTKSMRRVLRKNEHTESRIGKPEASPAKYRIYREYLDCKHDDSMSKSYESFYSFLYESPTDSWEITYYIDNKLVGVSIIDWCRNGLSSVYMFYDPEYSDKSLGIFSVIQEINFCKHHDLKYYYLGFYIEGSHTMDYKNRFYPNEILSPDYTWLTHRDI